MPSWLPASVTVILCGVAAFVVTMVLGVARQADAAESRPNLIYVVADDLGYGDLGCYGQQVIQTPHLDALAAEGMRFTDHYAGSTVCRPSRIVFLTGMHTGHTPVRANSQYQLQPDDLTVAELLQSVGYLTGGVGKWALGGVGSTGHPNRQGFDFWYGYLDQSEAHNYFPEQLFRNEQAETLPGNKIGSERRVSIQRTTYSHDRMADEAFDFIRQNRDGPFFLNCAFTIPHANNEGGRATGDGMEIPDHGIYAERTWPNPEKGQAAMITRLDRDMGRMVALIRELGIERQTLVLFTSDNGPHQEGGHEMEYFDANGPLRGFKRDLYEGGVRVPMIAWWPGMISPGTVSDHPSAFWDLLPTACELADVETPEHVDGISFLPTLLGKEQPKHEYLYWEIGEKTAIRSGHWKAVRTAADRPFELYDLTKDPGEQHDLAGDRADVVARLSEMAAEAHVDLPRAGK